MKENKFYYVIQIGYYGKENEDKYLVGYNCYSLVPVLTDDYMQAHKFVDLEDAKREMRFVRTFCCFEPNIAYFVRLVKIETRVVPFICV